MSAVWSTSFHETPARQASNQPSVAPLSSLLYRSRAVTALNDLELQQLINAAQLRNRTEGVTGLLIYYDGRFLQWLEGPADSLQRIWHSIRHDRRHTDIAMLSESPIRSRRFGRNSMALANHHAGSRNQTANDAALSPEMFETLYRMPDTLPSAFTGLAPNNAQYPTMLSERARFSGDATRIALTDLLLGSIVPKLVVTHVAAEPAYQVGEHHAGELARLLVAEHPEQAFALIDSLSADGRSLASLCAGLFEPTARALGDLWQQDDCSETELNLGLALLRAALRRPGVQTGRPNTLPRYCPLPHAVLVAPSPHEPHLLGSAIAAELFWRAGWDVHCEYPDSDEALSQLVHEQWYDVLDLSLSGAFTREHRLPAMAASIRAAHLHSLNPALTVIVDGRLFHEQPDAFVDVGADASIDDALGIVPVAQSQLKFANAARRLH